MNMLRKEEKRKFPRLSAYSLVKYRLFSEPDSQFILASLADVSGGGIRLVCEEELAKGTTIQLYINFPHLSNPVSCLAKVSWVRRIGKSNRYETGLEFLEIEDLLRQEMVKHIDNVRRRIR